MVRIALFLFQLQKFLKAYPDLLEYMHISDQYSGKKPDDSSGGGTAASANNSSSGNTVTAAPTNVVKVFQARFCMPRNGRTQPEDMEMMLPCLKLVLYFIDKLKRVKLSKEVKTLMNEFLNGRI